MLPTLRKRGHLPNLMDSFFNGDLVPEFFDWGSNLKMPAVNIVEGKENYKIELAAPGLDKTDFKIDLENNVLTISTEKNIENQEGDENYMRREFSYNAFSRSFGLPESANGEKISASYKDGILIVDIPKREEAKEKPPKTIKIS